jgi:hypothetical protein
VPVRFATKVGNASDSTVWSPSGPLVTGDTVALGTFAVTFDQNVDLGAPGADAISATTGAFTVAAGVTVTVRGNITSGNCTPILNAGARLVCDAGNPATAVTWLFGSANFQAASGLRCNGTLANRCRVGLSAGGQANLSINVPGPTPVPLAQSNALLATFTDFVGITSLYSRLSATRFDCRDCTFDGCFVRVETSATSSLVIQRTKFKNSPGASTIPGTRFDCGSVAVTAPAERAFEDVSFDKQVQFTGVPPSVNRALFYGGWSASPGTVKPPPWTNVICTDVTGPNDAAASSFDWDFDLALCLVDSAGPRTNPHGLRPLGKFNHALTNYFFESPNATLASDDGDCVLMNGSATAGSTLTVAGMIVPRIAAGAKAGHCPGVAVTWDPTNQFILIFEGNTVGQGVNCQETVAGVANSISSIKNNIFACVQPTQANRRAVFDVGTNNPVTDFMPAAAAQNNRCFGLLADRYSALEFSAGTPGANDTFADPQFVDPSRNLLTWAAANGFPATVAGALAAFDNDLSLLANSYAPYIRAGFAPQDSSLTAGGFGGALIGAVAVVLAGGGGGSTTYNYFNLRY